jgi:hypothetical protein
MIVLLTFLYIEKLFFFQFIENKNFFFDISKMGQSLSMAFKNGSENLNSEKNIQSYSIDQENIENVEIIRDVDIQSNVTSYWKCFGGLKMFRSCTETLKILKGQKLS